MPVNAADVHAHAKLACRPLTSLGGTAVPVCDICPNAVWSLGGALAAVTGGNTVVGLLGLHEHNKLDIHMPLTSPCGTTQVGGAGLAVLDKAEAGPLFGAEVRARHPS